MNEERYIADLLDSLVIQEGPVEIVVVDAASQDHTQDIVRKYVAKYPFIKMYVHPGRRGESTNFGIAQAHGEAIAFTGGDDLANPNWVHELRKTFQQGADIVAGRSIMIGLKAWEDLDRVELYHKGYDVSYPSANMLGHFVSRRMSPSLVKRKSFVLFTYEPCRGSTQMSVTSLHLVV